MSGPDSARRPAGREPPAPCSGQQHRTGRRAGPAGEASLIPACPDGPAAVTASSPASLVAAAPAANCGKSPQPARRSATRAPHPR